MDKNEELQKWLNDDRYVQIKELESLWGIGRPGVCNFLRTHKVKPLKKIFMGQNGNFFFYNLQQCERARQSKIAEIDNWKSNKLFITKFELAQMWGITYGGASSFMVRFGIKPVKNFFTGRGECAFYNRAECERARPFINQPEKEVEKVEKDQKIESAQLGGIFCGDIAIGKFAIVSSASDVLILKKVAGDIICPVLSVSTPDKNYDYIKKIIGNDICLVMVEDIDPDHKSVMYWLDLPGASPWIIRAKYGKNITEAHKNGVIIREFIEAGLYDECKGFYAGSSRKTESMPEPKEQTPDIIPADTIDLFTMSELESELKQRGVELTAEVKAKINASDMPDMQHIATMLRGNAKTIAIRLSVLNEIAEQLKNVEKTSFDWSRWLNSGVKKTESNNGRTSRNQAADAKLAMLKKPDHKKLKELGYLTSAMIADMVGMSSAWVLINAPKPDRTMAYGNQNYARLWKEETISDWLKTRREYKTKAEVLRQVSKIEEELLKLKNMLDGMK